MIKSFNWIGLLPVFVLLTALPTFAFNQATTCYEIKDLKPFVIDAKCGFELHGDILEHISAMIGFEKQLVEVSLQLFFPAAGWSRNS